MISYAERQKIPSSQWKQALAQFGCDLRVAIPGIIQSFNAAEMTVSVQPAINDAFRIDAVATDVALPLLEDVPLMLPRAGGWSITFPVAPGDECLIVFADMCIDSWWQAGASPASGSYPGGGPENQLERRRHDLSDGFAVLAPSSQPKTLSGYSTTSLQIRSDDGTVVIDLAAGAVTVTAPAITLGDGSGTPSGLMLAAFYTWFTTVYMPSVRYNTVAPPLPVVPVITATVKGE